MWISAACHFLGCDLLGIRIFGHFTLIAGFIFAPVRVIRGKKLQDKSKKQFYLATH
jgi:hypothetical protein